MVIVLAVAIGVPVLYVFSLGPLAFFFHDSHGPIVDVLKFVYDPLERLARHWPAAGRVLTAWVSLWRG